MPTEIETVTKNNISALGFFCYMSKRKSAGWKEKHDWVLEKLEHDITIRMLKLPERGFIEYIRSEYSMRPIVAAGYYVVHCLWVVGKSKGKGNATLLLNQCIDDAKQAGLNGVAMVASDIGYMKWKRLLRKNGFTVVDRAPNTYELLAIRFNESEWPAFSGSWDQKATACGKGLVILKTRQCPYFSNFTNELLEMADEKGMKSRVVELETTEDVLEKAPTPYGSYNVVIDGNAVPIFYQAKDILKKA